MHRSCRLQGSVQSGRTDADVRYLADIDGAPQRSRIAAKRSPVSVCLSACYCRVFLNADWIPRSSLDLPSIACKMLLPFCEICSFCIGPLWEMSPEAVQRCQPSTQSTHEHEYPLSWSGHRPCGPPAPVAVGQMQHEMLEARLVDSGRDGILIALEGDEGLLDNCPLLCAADIGLSSSAVVAC